MGIEELKANQKAKSSKNNKITAYVTIAIVVCFGGYLISLSDGNGFDPVGRYEVGVCEVFHIKRDGSVEYYQKDIFNLGGGNKNCYSNRGTWNKSNEAGVIVISGLQNSNCDSAVKANGRYKVSSGNLKKK